MSTVPTLDVLIGTDLPHLHISVGKDIGPPDPNSSDPFARKTPLGWMVYGKTFPGETVQQQKTVRRAEESLDQLRAHHFLMYAAYQKELGESDPPPSIDKQTELLRLIEHRLREQARLPETPPPGTRKLNFLERKAIQKWISTLCHDERGRLEISLPWRGGKPKFKDNTEGSLNWLCGLQKHLKQSSLEEQVTFMKVFQDWLKEEIIRIVPDDEKAPKEVNYIPYFPVSREDKATSKLRPMMNTAAEFFGKSLNKALLSGPNLLKDVRVSLLRFSKYAIALVGDIKQIFLQIGMRKEDRPYLRFHWVDPEGNEGVRVPAVAVWVDLVPERRMLDRAAAR
jgi:hypothetical protein